MNKSLNGYTIKTISSEGTYFLVNGFEKHQKIWVEEKDLKEEYLFTSTYLARKSLKKLLEFFDEWEDDEFSLVYFHKGNIIFDGSYEEKRRVG